MTFDWEIIYQKKNMPITFRAKVYGGWIVRTCDFFEGSLSSVQSESSVFISDPSHEWEVEK